MKVELVIRPAREEDLPVLLELARLMHQCSSYAPLDFDPKRVQQEFVRAMQEAFFLVAVSGTQIVGGLLGDVDRTWFGGDLVGIERGIFVRFCACRRQAAAALVQHFLAWAKLMGAKQIRPCVSTGYPQADHLYLSLGGVRQGSAFLFEGV